MSSVHFPPSISVPLFSPSPPSPPLPPTKGRLLGNPSPLDTAGLVTMAANSQSFSLSLSLPCFSVCTCSHILTVMWEGCPCSPWAFPGPAGEQSTCEQNSNAATGGKRLLCHALGMAHFQHFTCNLLAESHSVLSCITWQISFFRTELCVHWEMSHIPKLDTQTCLFLFRRTENKELMY